MGKTASVPMPSGNARQKTKLSQLSTLGRRKKCSTIRNTYWVDLAGSRLKAKRSKSKNRQKKSKNQKKRNLSTMGWDFCAPIRIRILNKYSISPAPTIFVVRLLNKNT